MSHQTWAAAKWKNVAVGVQKVEVYEDGVMVGVEAAVVEGHWHVQVGEEMELELVMVRVNGYACVEWVVR